MFTCCIALRVGVTAPNPSLLLDLSGSVWCAIRRSRLFAFPAAFVFGPSQHRGGGAGSTVSGSVARRRRPEGVGGSSRATAVVGIWGWCLLDYLDIPLDVWLRRSLPRSTCGAPCLHSWLCILAPLSFTKAG